MHLTATDAARLCGLSARYDDVRDGLPYVEQQKTGTRSVLPLDLRLDAALISLQEAIDATRKYRPHGEFLLRSP